MSPASADARLQGIVAILRLAESRLTLPVAWALVDGGIQALEITLTTPQALEAINEVANALGDRALVGAGSVVTHAGATLIKIFPARELGGPSYIKALRAPLPDLALVPTGGVVLDDVAAYRRAGAVAVGVGSPLLPVAVDADAITANARRFVSAWHTAQP